MRPFRIVPLWPNGINYIVIAGALASSGVAYADDDVLPFKMVQGNSKPQNSKPAELYYATEDDKSSYAVNAALMSNGFAIKELSGPSYTSEWVFSGAIAKDTVAKKPQDVRNLQVALGTEWELSNSASLSSTASLTLEDNRVTTAKGRMERFDLFYVQARKGSADLSMGESGFKTRLYPYAGIYQRHVTSTDDAIKAPEGRHGGVYAGIDARVTWGTVGDKSNWLSRVGVGINAYKLRDSTVSAAYTKESFKYAAVSLTLALYDSASSPLKPSVALTRSVGSDRLANKDYQALTKLVFQVGYGL